MLNSMSSNPVLLKEFEAIYTANNYQALTYSNLEVNLLCRSFVCEAISCELVTSVNSIPASTDKVCKL